MPMPPLILASESPRRAQLLRQLDLEFQILPAKVQESESEHLTPAELAQINAYHKARHVAKAHADCLVLGADTVVCLGHRIFGKPRDLADAHRMLSALQGHTHRVLTGVCLLHWRSHNQALFVETTFVTFRPLDTLAIRKYLSLVNPLDKAGAYALQEHGDRIVDSVEGSSSNVVGLPLERLHETLLAWPNSQ